MRANAKYETTDARTKDCCNMGTTLDAVGKLMAGGGGGGEGMGGGGEGLNLFFSSGTPKAASTNKHIITKTCLYNLDPAKSYFYIGKLGFTGVYIIFSKKKHRLWALVRTASSMILNRNMKNIRVPLPQWNITVKHIWSCKRRIFFTHIFLHSLFHNQISCTDQCSFDCEINCAKIHMIKEGGSVINCNCVGNQASRLSHNIHGVTNLL